MIIWGLFLSIGSVTAIQDCATGHSYCDLALDSQLWIRGAGIPIKSWVKSVVPNDNNCSASGAVRLVSNADGDFAKLSVENILWRKYGPNPYDGDLYEDGTIQAYIYDDMVTALVGKFNQDDFLLEGRATKIVAFKCHKGILKLRLSKKSSPEVYVYDPINVLSMPKASLLMDPLERRQLYVNDSLLNGLNFNEGVFAKKFIPGMQYSSTTTVIIKDYNFQPTA